MPESHYQVTSPAGNEARWRDNGKVEKGGRWLFVEEGESHGNMELRGPKTVLRNTLTGREKIIESPMGSNAGDIPRRNFFLFSLSPFLPTRELSATYVYVISFSGKSVVSSFVGKDRLT